MLQQEQGATAHLAICAMNGVVCVSGVLILHKAEAARATGLYVVDDLWRGSLSAPASVPCRALVNWPRKRSADWPQTHLDLQHFAPGAEKLADCPLVGVVVQVALRRTRSTLAMPLGLHVQRGPYTNTVAFSGPGLRDRDRDMLL